MCPEPVIPAERGPAQPLTDPSGSEQHGSEQHGSEPDPARMPPSAPAGPALSNGLRIEFPPELPISARVADIGRAVAESQVVIVAGATGSGKTTQLPKLMLALGRGSRRRIGVTQPRRIAATSIAQRVASELGTNVGQEIGYQIRFEDRSHSRTRVKFMTDGILLAETQTDRLLRQYDTLIIDEAHERSLNIDFLLGWLKRILSERPDLKVVVSSATLDTQRFAEFFGQAKVIEVEGRTYPVEVLYEAPDPELDLSEAVGNAVVNLTSLDNRGDVLVFLPGEREIHEAERELQGRKLRHTAILPLYGRLSSAEQRRVFTSGPERRIILATNVAETSLTLPGIVYVVDAGYARLSRYDPRTGTTRLALEAISQASADQRKGRAGRVREGLCLRLYDEESFRARPAFTDPEVLRVGLASVILRMKALGLGAVEEFPFLDPPAPRAITEGYRVLQELGALNAERELTDAGRRLARLPVDPRIGRMILAGAEYGCLPEVLVVAAALSVQDPRERPRAAEQKADQQHQRFRDERSDFVGWLKLWDFLREVERSAGKAGLRRACKDGFLNFIRVREWQEIHRQLLELAEELRLPLRPGGRDSPHRDPRPRDNSARDNSARDRQHRSPQHGGRPRESQNGNLRGRDNALHSSPKKAEVQAGAGGDSPANAGDTSDALHMALLSGLLSKVGYYNSTERVYVGAKQTRFVLHPSSALAKRPPAWVMAFELVHTSQLFARNAARIDPNWFERVGSHLLKRSYEKPHWSEKSGRTVIEERSTLFGLPVPTRRQVDYATISSSDARRWFIDHALVRGEYKSKGAFEGHNRALLAEVARLRDKARQSDMLADDEALFAFFDRLLPASVVNGKTFESFREEIERTQPKALHLQLSDVLASEQGLTEAHYPDQVEVSGERIALHYLFDPSAETDGLTLDVPLLLLPSFDPRELDWTIPGWHLQRITALIEALPKALRKELGNVNELAARAAERLTPFRGPFLAQLAQTVSELACVNVPESAFRPETLPPFLRPTLRVVDNSGHALGQSRELAMLFEQLLPKAREELRALAPVSNLERTKLTAWNFGELPAIVERRSGGLVIKSYPALMDRVTHVDLLLLDSSSEAERATRAGVRRLLRLVTRRSLSSLNAKVPRGFAPTSGRTMLNSPDFEEQFWNKVFDQAFGLQTLEHLPTNQVQFEQLLGEGSPRIAQAFNTLNHAVLAIAGELEATQRVLARAAEQPMGRAVASSVRAQLEQLLPADALSNLEITRLAQIPRYLKAAQTRVQRALADPRKDAEKLAPIESLVREFQALRAPADARASEARARVRWQLEELRVAIFAPELKTGPAVTVASVGQAIQALK
ncbi:MAG TPA: ATP-dependent RNA helicase HrpA [Polyangiaceae bacterium]|nr:ATP-dependent RNA helicase HrpA [Polyangiaceae bacterium]